MLLDVESDKEELGVHYFWNSVAVYFSILNQFFNFFQGTIFVAISVGNCRAYHWSFKEKRLREVTDEKFARNNSNSEPGGQLGPAINKECPDLRNLHLYVKEKEKEKEKRERV